MKYTTIAFSGRPAALPKLAQHSARASDAAQANSLLASPSAGNLQDAPIGELVVFEDRANQFGLRGAMPIPMATSDWLRRASCSKYNGSFYTDGDPNQWMPWTGQPHCIHPRGWRIFLTNACRARAPPGAFSTRAVK